MRVGSQLVMTVLVSAMGAEVALTYQGDALKKRVEPLAEVIWHVQPLKPLHDVVAGHHDRLVEVGQVPGIIAGYRT